MIAQMKKIICVTPEGRHITSFYRFLGPFQELQKDKQIEIEVPHQFFWPETQRADIVFLQRPSEASHMQVIGLCKNMGIPTWVDYDDDLFDIPIDNKAYSSYGPKEKEMMKWIIQNVGKVSVSTDTLKEKLIEVSGVDENKIVTIRNAVHTKLYDRMKIVPKKKKDKIVFWRGPESHASDLYSVKDELIEVVKARPDWKFYFAGFCPYFLMNEIPKEQFFYVQPCDITLYLRFLGELEPQITIVPLLDNPLNRAKSNIAWLEATWAKSAVLAPDFPEWKQPGVWRYETAPMFKDLLLEMTNLQTILQDNVSASKLKIDGAYCLHQQNSYRQQIIEELAP